jgi:NTP pyrophosphatase (non-canonical NTP hydrolase)
MAVDATSELEALRVRLRSFAAERDWDQFHSPKNLAMALAGEAGELLEVFQWLSEEQSYAVRDDPRQLAPAAEEMADVFLYLIRLADRLGIDLVSAAHSKIDANARKYPAADVRGSAAKR